MHVAVDIQSVDAGSDPMKDEGAVRLGVGGPLSVVEGYPRGVGQGFTGGEKQFSLNGHRCRRFVLPMYARQ